jgi:MFS family permease
MEIVSQSGVDPREVIANAPMGVRQKLIIAICVLILAIDGYDILSIGFAAPAIAAKWGIAKPMLGLVLSMELVGMAAGSLVLGRVADLAGRRPTTMACLVLIATGMALASLASGVTGLSLCRLVTGFGIGGVLSCTSAVAAEVSSTRAKGAAVTLMASGVPIGALLGGPVAGAFLASGNWSAVFLFGAVVTALLVPLCWAVLPETPAYLFQARGRKAGRLVRINAVLSKFGHPPVERLSIIDADRPRGLFRQLTDGGYLRVTLMLTLAYFLHMISIFFMMKWLPTIIVDLGHAAPDGVAVLLWLNAGGLCGCVLIALASLKLDNRVLVPAVLAGAGLAILLFGQTPNDLFWLKVMAAVTGFAGQAAVVGFYAIIAQSFPSYLRATGAGLVLGVGRAGSALGPMAAGALFAEGVGLVWVMSLMSLGSLLGATVLYSQRNNRRQAH